jgi:hypothetical protein
MEVVRRAIGGITLEGLDADARAAAVERLARDAEFEEARATSSSNGSPRVGTPR